MACWSWTLIQTQGTLLILSTMSLTIPTYVLLRNTLLNTEDLLGFVLVCLLQSVYMFACFCLACDVSVF